MECSARGAHGVLLTTRTFSPTPPLKMLCLRSLANLHSRPSFPASAPSPAGAPRCLGSALLFLRPRSARGTSEPSGFRSSSPTSYSSALSLENRLHSSPSSEFSSSSGPTGRLVPGINLLGLQKKMEQEHVHFVKAQAGGGPADVDFQDDELPIKTRKVVEHVVLFKMKDTLTEEQEKEMLDGLWSLQYQIRNIITTSVGRLIEKTSDGYTHALFTRFPSKEALSEYMDSPIRWRVAQDLVIPYYNGLLMADFEGDVEDDIETVFRRGDDFQEGLEHLFLFSFKDGVSSDVVDKLIKSVAFSEENGDIVQLTVGSNFYPHSMSNFSHGIVARMTSAEAYKKIKNDPLWEEAKALFESSKTLTANYLVSPVGKTVM